MATSAPHELQREARSPVAEAAVARRPLRIVFSLLHAGYLRHYGDPIRILAGRGHHVRVTLYRHDPGDRDAVLLDRLLADCETVSWGMMPRRRFSDGWRGIAWTVRALIDVLRYADPRYDAAPALRERAAEKVRVRMRGSARDPVTRWLLRRLLDRVVHVLDGASAARHTRRLLAVEQAIPTSRRVDRLLRAYGAEVVLASPVVEIGSPQVEFVKSARRLAIPSAVAVASWDNLTSKGLLRVIPDRVLVWNELQVRELEEMHGVERDRIVVTGAQKFDPWFELSPSASREEFMRRRSLDPRFPYLLYLCSSSFIAPAEVEFVRRWIRALRASGDERVRLLGVLVRPHPQNARPWADADLSEFENVAVWPRAGASPDAGDARTGFFDAISHSEAVVGINTSAQIDAAIVGKPVYTVRAFSSSQEGTLHFHYLLHENGGFVRDAASLEEHVEQLAAGLSGATGRAAEIERFVSGFVRPHGLDRPVAPIVADAIEALGRIEVVPLELPASARVLRWSLLPLAFVTGIAAAPGVVVQRIRNHRGSKRSPAEVASSLPDR